MEELFPDLARIAQEVYDAWTVMDGKGRCIEIAERWCEFLITEGYKAQVAGLDQEHTNVNVLVDGKWVNVDLPAGYYEYVYSGNWVKFPNVKILAEWIEITLVTIQH